MARYARCQDACTFELAAPAASIVCFASSCLLMVFPFAYKARLRAARRRLVAEQDGVEPASHFVTDKIIDPFLELGAPLAPVQPLQLMAVDHALRVRAGAHQRHNCAVRARVDRVPLRDRAHRRQTARIKRLRADDQGEVRTLHFLTCRRIEIQMDDVASHWYIRHYSASKPTGAISSQSSTRGSSAGISASNCESA